MKTGATDRNRTGTPLRTQDFKSWASTYSATVACMVPRSPRNIKQKPHHQFWKQGFVATRTLTGGAVRSRTGLTGFAIRGITALLPRQTLFNKKGKRLASLFLGIWSGKRVSNSRPQPWQGCALPTELFPRFKPQIITLFLDALQISKNFTA